jgi:hypothetical protein
MNPKFREGDGVRIQAGSNRGAIGTVFGYVPLDHHGKTISHTYTVKTWKMENGRQIPCMVSADEIELEPIGTT